MYVADINDAQDTETRESRNGSCLPRNIQGGLGCQENFDNVQGLEDNLGTSMDHTSSINHNQNEQIINVKLHAICIKQEELQGNFF